MPKGRKHRLETFGTRAETFAKNLLSGKGFRREKDASGKPLPGVRRSHRWIRVGKGQHRRLIAKRHLEGTLVFQTMMERYFKKTGAEPEIFVYVPIKAKEIEVRARGGASRFVNVQEYFEKPTIAELKTFLEMKAKGKRGWLSRESELICRKFLGHPQHKGITVERLVALRSDIFKHIREAEESAGRKPSYTWLVNQNTLVLGQTREGKLRIAIADV